MPEYGEVENTRSWSNANVWVAFRDEVSGEFPPLPATINDDMPAGWEMVGLLDGDQGFTESTTETTTDTFAWGSILVASRKSDQRDTKTFTAYETNELTDRLRSIEETPDGMHTQFRRPAEAAKVCFEKIDGAKNVAERQFTANYAEIAINGDRAETETNPQVHPFIATVFPGTDLALYKIQRAAVSS